MTNICLMTEKEKSVETSTGTDNDKLSETHKRKDIKQPEGEMHGSDKAEPTRFGDWEVGGRCTDF